ncbi:uncharacterized protein LOC124896877 [Capsicum annuum]|uniref:uncharacterized protein LOC124896877 n=1 Tax=Capsicum annuum TaxID=4072 RepID=UPI001FB0D79B|nr:uncharacterized protein LOC124896877 [Capsicum annuum]
MFQHVEQNKKIVDESVGEAKFSDSQNTFPDEEVKSINLDFIQQNLRVRDDSKNIEAAAEIIENTSMADCEKPNLDEQINSEVHNHEAVFGEGKSQPDLRDSQVTIPDELLPNLNEYVNLKRSIIVHSSANKEQTPLNVSRIKKPSKFKESPFTTKFGSAEGSTEVQTKKFKLKHPFESHPIFDIEDTKVTNKFMTWLSVELLKYHAKKSNKEEYYLKNKSKISALNLAFYQLKARISSMLWVFLNSHGEMRDCGLYMITYAKCLTFSGSVPKVDFDPDLLRTRYTSMLWHYSTKK